MTCSPHLSSNHSLILYIRKHLHHGQSSQFATSLIVELLFAIPPDLYVQVPLQVAAAISAMGRPLHSLATFLTTTSKMVDSKDLAFLTNNFQESCSDKILRGMTLLGCRWNYRHSKVADELGLLSGAS
ncbi:hypothetical protein RchiOBHm_Chr5g0079481 [Rosa chinensis]|uniref:Uncharacterized protein n=1 Tax=Rosa chinensis TaxID=74649 RepID=A0A2P6QMK0_ROSCH|nr:hypothetical protein RchiOBHm_Chr5g0079481 [Rosa chinensis]